MRVYKNKPFARFARKYEISDADLCVSVHEVTRAGSTPTSAAESSSSESRGTALENLEDFGRSLFSEPWKERYLSTDSPKT